MVAVTIDDGEVVFFFLDVVHNFEEAEQFFHSGEDRELLCHNILETLVLQELHNELLQVSPVSREFRRYIDLLCPEIFS